MFARTQMGVDRLVEQLREVGVRAGGLHGGKTQRVRTRTLAEFKEGRTNVLVATDVAARGIHVDGVSLVVHVDPPKDPKDYLHRAGRTARAGESGAVATLVLPKQRRTTLSMMDKAGVAAPAEHRVRVGDAEAGRAHRRPRAFRQAGRRRASSRGQARDQAAASRGRREGGQRDFGGGRRRESGFRRRSPRRGPWTGQPPRVRCRFRRRATASSAPARAAADATRRRLRWRSSRVGRRWRHGASSAEATHRAALARVGAIALPDISRSLVAAAGFVRRRPLFVSRHPREPHSGVASSPLGAPLSPLGAPVIVAISGKSLPPPKLIARFRGKSRGSSRRSGAREAQAGRCAGEAARGAWARARREARAAWVRGDQVPVARKCSTVWWGAAGPGPGRLSRCRCSTC